MLARLASAALAGAAIAAAVALTLQAALGAVGGDLRPMALIGSLFDWLRWILAIALVRVVVPRFDRRLAQTSGAPPHLSKTDAWACTGIVLVAFPVAWEVAMLLIMTTRLFMAGTLATSSSVFLESSFYSDVIVTYAPWLLAGVTLLAWRAHVDDGSPPERGANGDRPGVNSRSH
jgi:hypothetical protein